VSTYVRVAAASTGPAGDDLSTSLGEAEQTIVRLAEFGAELVVLPELFAWPYVASDDPANWGHLAEPIDGATARWAAGQAVRHGVNIVFGMALADSEAKPFNAALLARRDGSIVRVATKLNLPPPGHGENFGEADHFRPGIGNVECFELGGVRVAVLICYDRRFPECWQAAVRSGAELVVVLVGGPAPQDPDGFYINEMRGHARANAVYALAAARAGVETVLGRDVRHDGLTLAINPFGAVLSEGEGAAGDVVIIDVDPAVIAAARSGRGKSGMHASTSII
jgi:N-carbamoylputrescine amidase